MKRFGLILLAISIGFSGFMGCASKKAEDSIESRIQKLEQQTKETEARLDSIHSEMMADVGTIRQGLAEHQKEIAQLKKAIDESLNDAVERAIKNQKLSKGKLLYEVTISDAAIPFAYNRYDLSKEAKAALDAFAKMLIAENKEVYIEIQGHTDNIGSEKYNLELGQQRANSTLRYLHLHHGIPLNRMSTFSYGEARPVVPNDSEANRAKNRRVVLLVME